MSAKSLHPSREGFPTLEDIQPFELTYEFPHATYGLPAITPRGSRA